METAIHSTSSKVQRSWKQRIGLPAMVLLTVAVSTIFGLQTLDAKPALVASHAGSSDTLRLQQAVMDLDEAAAGASWAQMQAMEWAASTHELAATTVLVGIGCGADCLTLIWPSGLESTTSLAIAFDYAAICGCSIAMQSASQPTSAAIDASTQHALKEQRIAEWTETYVPQLAEQRPVLPSQSADPAAVKIAAQNALKAQRIAEWTEYNVTQLAEQGASLANRTSALDAPDAAARNALTEQRIADWTELNVTQPATQGH